MSVVTSRHVSAGQTSRTLRFALLDWRDIFI